MFAFRIIKKNWELKEDNKSTLLIPKSKTFLAIYREDQKIALDHLIPKKINDRKIKMVQMLRDEALKAFEIWDKKVDKIKY